MVDAQSFADETPSKPPVAPLHHLCSFCAATPWLWSPTIEGSNAGRGHSPLSRATRARFYRLALAAITIA